MERVMLPEIRDCERVDALRLRTPFYMLASGVALLLISLIYRSSSSALFALFLLVGVSGILEALASFSAPAGLHDSRKEVAALFHRGGILASLERHFGKIHLMSCHDYARLGARSDSYIYALYGYWKPESPTIFHNLRRYCRHNVGRPTIQQTSAARYRNGLRGNLFLALRQPFNLYRMGRLPCRGGMQERERDATRPDRIRQRAVLRLNIKSSNRLRSTQKGVVFLRSTPRTSSRACVSARSGTRPGIDVRLIE